MAMDITAAGLRNRRIAISVTGLVVILVLLELVARLLVPVKNTSIYEEHSNIITVSGLKRLNETMEFDPRLFWKLKDSLENFRVAGSIRNTPIDFRLNTRDGLRNRPISPVKESYRILALGDSCTFGLGVNDDETWPAQLETLLAAEEFKPEIINTGVPGYTVFQGKQFLSGRGLSLQPDMVVACFGFNEVIEWRTMSDIETAYFMNLYYYDRILSMSRLYYGLKTLLFRFQERGRSGSLETRAEGSGGNRDQALIPRLNPDEFVENLIELRDVCSKNDIVLVLIIWPYSDQISRRFNRLVAYQQLIHEFGRRNNVPVVNLVNEFITDGNELFLDNVHANSRGCSVTASAVHKTIIPFLTSGTKQ